MKRIIIGILLTICGFSNFAFAQIKPGWIPEASKSNIGEIVENVWEWWKVIDNYKDAAYWKIISQTGRIRGGSDLNLGDQFASWIMTWDTILDYATFLVKYLWNIALLAGALMIIYYGYKKATEHLKVSGGGGGLWKVVMWILVIIFAYVIVKIVWSMFIS